MAVAFEKVRDKGGESSAAVYRAFSRKRMHFFMRKTCNRKAGDLEFLLFPKHQGERLFFELFRVSALFQR